MRGTVLVREVILGRLLVAGLIAYLRLEDRSRWLRHNANGPVVRAADAILADDEKQSVTDAVYDRVFARRRRRQLQTWETAWLTRRLPAPPATVLVGAAGQGAEVLHLLRSGYSVDAFEPSKTALAACRRVMGSGLLVRTSYREICDAADGSDGPASPLAARTYDAILLGWGSFSHVLSPSDREKLLKTCSTLCPSGPVLASFLLAQSLGGARTLALTPWAGFVRLLDAEELNALARANSRTLIWETDAETSYPHVTFLPA